MSLASSLGSLATGVGNLIGSFNNASSVSNSTSLDPSTARYYYNESRAADARALSNSKDLYTFQQQAGPSLLMRGYEQAGLNPVLAGSYGTGSMPSGQGTVMSAPAGSTSTTSKNKWHQMADAVSSASQLFSSLNLQRAQMDNLSANAASLLSRAESDRRLTDAQVRLKDAQTLSESVMPAKLKSAIAKEQGDVLLNEVKRRLAESELVTNAKNLEQIDSLINYRKHLLSIMGRKDYFNLPFGLGRIYGSASGDDYGMRVVPKNSSGDAPKSSDHHESQKVSEFDNGVVPDYIYRAPGILGRRKK